LIEFENNAIKTRQLEQLRRGEIITEQEVKELCTKAREILIEESNVQRVDAPVTVNIHYIYFIYKIHNVINPDLLILISKTSNRFVEIFMVIIIFNLDFRRVENSTIFKN
jgi:hypothetical protein